MLKTESNYNDVFLVRDAILRVNGYSSYDEFLRSDYWKSIRLKVKQAKYRCTYDHCWICRTVENIELHHENYRYLLTKYELRSIRSLCRNCHKLVHEVAKQKDIPLNKAYEIVSDSKGKSNTFKGFVCITLDQLLNGTKK